MKSNKQPAQSQRSNWLTLLAVISCISVVFLHTNGCYWEIPVSNPNWPGANVIECLFYFAVPCFFMISGANLFDYKERYTTKEYFIKRVKRTLLPYFVWSTLAFVGEIVAQVIMGDKMQFIDLSKINFVYILNGYINSTFVEPYWFFIAIFVVYLFIPIIANVNKQNRHKVARYIALIGILVNSLIPFILNVANVTGLTWSYVCDAVFGPIIYACIGYSIKNTNFKLKHELPIYFFAIVGLLTHLLGTHYYSLLAGEIVQTFKGYYTPQTIAYSVGITLLVKRFGDKLMSNKLLPPPVNFLSRYTLSIYITHIFSWGILYYLFSISPLGTTSLLYRLGGPFLIIPLSVGFTWLIRKIPYVRAILP